MDDSPNLVSTFTFKDKPYLVKMYVINSNTLELSVTDKHTAEEWRCSYDATYIENLTHKTGNYKNFDVFITMLKSGLLKTSECVGLELLTVDDLECLRTMRVSGKASCGPPRTALPRVGNNSNRRYLILTYSVEFDRIHYPLPLEYCGPPDPQVLQGIIRKLEAEVERLQIQLNSPEFTQKGNRDEVAKLQLRVDELTLENKALVQDVHELNKRLSRRASSYQQMQNMQAVMKAIEEQVVQERTSFQRLLHKLRDEKTRLQLQVDQLRVSERSLRSRLRFCGVRTDSPPPHYPSVHQLPARAVVRGPMYAAAGPARAPADGLSPIDAKGPGPRPLTARRSAPQQTYPNRAAAAPKQIPSSTPRRLSPCKRRAALQSKSASCCHGHPSRRSSSESSRSSSRVLDLSRRLSPGGRKSTGAIGVGALQCPRHGSRPPRQTAPPPAPTRPRSASGSRAAPPPASVPALHHHSEGQPSRRPRRHRRTHSVSGQSQGSRRSDENCSCVRCSSRGSRCSSSSSRVGRSGSGDRLHRKSETHELIRHTSNKDVRRGMSDLEERIKALQKLLKEGLPMK